MASLKSHLLVFWLLLLAVCAGLALLMLSMFHNSVAA